MAILSSDVTAGDDILDSDHNNLRTDLLTGDVAIAGVKTFGGKPIFSAGVTLSDDSSIAATKKFYYDGGNNTYALESAGDIVSYYAGGVNSCYYSAFGFGVMPTMKLYVDGGGGTYFIEDTDGVVYFYANTTLAALYSADGFSVGSIKKLGLDGGGDTYFIESSDNVADLYTGGSIALRVDASQNAVFAAKGTFGGIVRIPDNTALEFGTAGDYIAHNSTGDQFEFFIDGGRVGYVLSLIHI